MHFKNNSYFIYLFILHFFTPNIVIQLVYGELRREVLSDTYNLWFYIVLKLIFVRAKEAQKKQMCFYVRY